MEEEDRRNYQILETKKAEEMVWLLKCPQRVANTWRELAASSSSDSDSDSLAKFCVAVDPLRPDYSSELTMEMIGEDLWIIPKVYSITQRQDDFCAMKIFSENQGELAVAVEGTVIHRLNMRPSFGDFEEYANLVRERNTKPLVQDGHTQALVNDVGEHSRPKPLVVKKKLKRRTRSDRGEVIAKMLKLYESQPKWTMIQLEKEIDQPALFLRELLKELCVFNRKGSTYELKPESLVYRKQ